MIRRAVRGVALGMCLLGAGMAAKGAVVPARAMAAQVLLAHVFDHSVVAGRLAQVWLGADIVPVARISVARLGVADIVLGGGTDAALAEGPTVVGDHAPGGQSPIVVMAAHRDTHFRFIRDMVRGDVVQVETSGGVMTRYRVTGFQTERPEDFALPAHPSRRMLALVTCYPFAWTGHAPWRRIVWAEAIA
jgi:sortase A